MSNKDFFETLKKNILNIDPVYFCQQYLTLEGKPFQIQGNGYLPFADIYRYIGIKALEPNSKPVIMVKGRQVGGTTMAGALECYFMGCGLFGVNGRPPIKIIHTFPILEQAAGYAKAKFSALINSSIIPEGQKAIGGKVKSYMQALLANVSANDSLHFKQFIGGNHIWIDSTGMDGDRLRGKSVDVIFFDECFPYDQYIETINGKQKIGDFYTNYINNLPNPLVKTFNEKTEQFEFKRVIKAWEKQPRKLLEIICNNIKIKCTPNHRFLTNHGWKQAQDLSDDLLLLSNNTANICTIKYLEEEQIVYDIKVEDNHNFILAFENQDFGPIAHNCQDTPGEAINNTLKLLNQSRYGAPGKGVRVFYGTPKKKGSDFYKMWQASCQQYFHLGCEKCKQHFPLYTPGSDEWEKIWLHTFIVKCTHCGHEQDKRQAADRGKWVPLRNPDDCDMMGFHINQLYMPHIPKESIISEKPGIHPTNTERAYQNEVLGEFFQGDASPITPEEIIEVCGDRERKMRAMISPSDNLSVFLGIDYGLKADLEQLANPNKESKSGQSYSTAVVISVQGPNLFSIERAMKFKRNDIESKKGIIDSLMRQYSINLAVGDIGFSQDFSSIMHVAYGDKYLVSRAHNNVNNKIKFNEDAFPKEITFERDHYIGELLELLKKGNIKFPLGHYDQISWLIHHCASMELKPVLSKYGDHSIHYVKGSSPNDGFMALLNAYLAYKFYITNGFKIKNPLLQNDATNNKKKVLAITGAGLFRGKF